MGSILSSAHQLAKGGRDSLSKSVTPSISREAISKHQIARKVRGHPAGFPSFDSS